MSDTTRLSRFAGALISAALGAFVFAGIGLPLPYILGSMIGSALFTNIVAPPSPTRHVRRVGQIVLGTSVASILTLSTLGILLELLPIMVGVAVFANLIGLAMALPVARLIGIDRISALLATLPAGMAEMASLAADLKARAEFVTVCHTLRVVLVVFTLPVVIGFHGTIDRTASAGHGSFVALAACFAMGLILSLLADRLHILNPWIVMPMIVGVGLVLGGYEIAPMPRSLIVAAQVAIGFSLGSRLDRKDLLRLPRATIVGLCASALLIMVMLTVARFVLVPALEPDWPTLALAVAPGGLGEMIATAKALGLASATVASFQFVRTFLTNVAVPPLILLVTDKAAKK